jgi:hypothetical protein
MSNSMYRQGDVLIVATETVDQLGKEIPMEKMGPVLAWGEVTGHHHTVVAEPESYDPVKDLPDYHPEDHEMNLRDWANSLLANIEFGQAVKGPAARLYEDDGGDYRRLVVDRDTLLRHEEHPAIALAPGHYKIIQQQEFSPEGWVRVQD